jgi:5-methylcytosine-specific restriction endonuclease McrA
MRREFSAKVKEAAFDRAQGRCETCLAEFAGRVPEYDHILPDWLGGEPTLENCRCMCAKCHRAKTSGEDVPRIAKTKRTKRKAIGAWPKTSRPLRSRGFPKRKEREHV